MEENDDEGKIVKKKNKKKQTILNKIAVWGQSGA
jgi:hypothetical protein